MGYGDALLLRDVGRERKKLEKESSWKGLLGSIGRTLGTIALTAFVGPAAGVFKTGLAAAGGSLFGGFLGSKAAGPISGGKFYESERKDIKRQTDPFGEEAITGALTAGVTAGIAQKLKIARDVSKAEAIAASLPGATSESIAAAGKGVKEGIGGFDFYSSPAGRGPIGKLAMDNLAKKRLSAWELAGGTTDEVDFSEWLRGPRDLRSGESAIPRIY